MKCFYTILGLPVRSSRKEIKSQFYRLSKLYHPDLADNNSESRKTRFNEIMQAYSVLSDDKLRRQYDIDNGHMKLRLGRQEPPSYNQYIRSTPFTRPNLDQEQDLHEDLRKRWERLDRKSVGAKSRKEDDQVYKAMRQEDYRVFRNRAIGAFELGRVADRKAKEDFVEEVVRIESLRTSADADWAVVEVALVDNGAVEDTVGEGVFAAADRRPEVVAADTAPLLVGGSPKAMIHNGPEVNLAL